MFFTDEETEENEVKQLGQPHKGTDLDQLFRHTDHGVLNYYVICLMRHVYSTCLPQASSYQYVSLMLNLNKLYALVEIWLYTEEGFAHAMGDILAEAQCLVVKFCLICKYAKCQHTKLKMEAKNCSVFSNMLCPAAMRMSQTCSHNPCFQ